MTKGRDDSSNKQVGSFLSSLGNLPPLSGLPKSTENLSTSSGDVKDTGQGKSVMDSVLGTFYFKFVVVCGVTNLMVFIPLKCYFDHHIFRFT